jgi:uncharacterized surface protein with fasciclin (FAS1) repeats
MVGVIHILPDLLLPEGFTLLNSAEKVLLSINATRFVSLLRTANLSSTYAGSHDNGESWTILAPSDEVLDTMDQWAGHGGYGLESEFDIPYKDSSPLASLLRYHILPGRLLPEDIHDGMLVKTELRTSALKGGRQRLDVDISESLDPKDWDTINVGEIRFGGATVLGKPGENERASVNYSSHCIVKTGKSIIYLISSLLSLPDDVLQTAISDLQLSTFIAAVYAADLDRMVKRTPGVTYLIPRNRAFNNLGLAMKYLLLPEGKDDLRKLVRYHAIQGVVYSHDVEAGRRSYKTLEGSEIVLERLGSGINSTITISSPFKWEGYDSGMKLPSNGQLRPANMTHSDALTSTGVIHTIDSVIMPANIGLTNGKLIRGSRQNVMAELMLRGGLSWVLEGREPSQEEVSRVELNGKVKASSEDGVDEGIDLGSLAMPGYVVLCPTDKAFSRLNLTAYIRDPPALLDLLKLHIIPTQPSTTAQSSIIPVAAPRDGQPLSMGDDLVYSTLLSGKSKFGELAFRATGDNTYLVGIRGARGGIERGGSGEVARIGAGGKSSVRWRKRVAMSEHEGADPGGMTLWRGGMALGGGVMMIDSVLIPYEPTWFSR